MPSPDGGRILSRLETDFYNECHVRESVTTTFDWLHDLEKAGSPNGTIVIAERQTAARGRRGRAWQSPAGGAWFGILLKPQFSVTLIGWVSIVTAVAIAQAIRAKYNRPVEVKWPNDLLLYKRKLCGILCELTTSGNRVESLLLGAGVNVNNPVPKDARIEAISLAESLGQDINLEDFFVSVLDSFAREYQQFISMGIGSVKQKFESLSALQDVVWIDRGESKLPAKVLGLSELGRLVVELNGKVEELVADEVTLNLKE